MAVLHYGDKATYTRLLEAYRVILSATPADAFDVDHHPVNKATTKYRHREIKIRVPVIRRNERPGGPRGGHKTRILGFNGLPHEWRHLLAAIVRHFGPVSARAVGNADVKTTGCHIVFDQVRWEGSEVGHFLVGKIGRSDAMTGHELFERTVELAEAFRMKGLSEAEIQRLLEPHRSPPKIGRRAAA